MAKGSKRRMPTVKTVNMLTGRAAEAVEEVEQLTEDADE